MKSPAGAIAAEPFFLKTDSGNRFCLYHTPSRQRRCSGAFIYVHPFADEMNKSRRMAALQARAFARTGFAVLQIDLFGCGDSSGEFGDARWDIWKRDLVIARDWLENRAAAPVSLWGLRLGALLALDFARNSENAIDKIILWQPVISGESFLTQFLRLRLANEMLSHNENPQKASGTKAMRNVLANGETLEVAGYELAAELALSIDNLKLVDFALKMQTVHWFEVVAERGRPVAPAGARVISVWEQHDVDLHVHLVPCLPFWATQEISECTELVSATTTIFTEESR